MHTLCKRRALPHVCGSGLLVQHQPAGVRYVRGFNEKLAQTPSSWRRNRDVLQEVLCRAPRAIEILGPALEDEARLPHDRFWAAADINS
jgi:hypothetical protein